jgi:HrpA-like RNA helicase
VSEAIEKKAKEVNVPIIPLHSQLEAEMQQKAFASYPNGKIILATNIAQTSVTIDDIDLVVDSGLERRSEVRDGVEGLFIAQISQADSLQRAGRAGRTKPGEYILAPYGTMPCLPFDEREPYGIPEILRKHIDRLTLRLANVGIDIETLDFYHDPSKKAIQRAKRTLRALGALTQMEQFPVESSYARMLVEVRQYSQEVQAKLAAIIAIQEVGGIIKGGTKYTGWRAYTRQTKSDLLAQYDVYLALPNILPDMFEDMGIISKNVTKAEEVIERLHHDLGMPDAELAPIAVDEEDPLMRSIVAGQIDQLWTATEKGEVEHIVTGQTRELSESSVVRNPRLVAGTPFDLQVPTFSGGLETLHLLQGITVVDVNWLLALAPDSFDNRRGKIYYDPRLGSLAERQQLRFGKKVLEGTSTPLLEDTRENRTLFVREFARWAYEQTERQRRQLERFHRRVPSVSQREVEQQVKVAAKGVVSVDQLIGLSRLETYFGDEFVRNLGEPHRHHAHEKRRRGWTPRHKRRGEWHR